MQQKPSYQNPLGGGQAILVPNPGAGIADRFPGNPNRKPADPIMQGFQDSEFRKNANMMQQDVVNFKYDGKDMMMNGSMSGAFKQYLDSIGKGDLYEGTAGLSQPLTEIGGGIPRPPGYNFDYGRRPNNPNDPANLGSAGGPSLFPFPGMDSTETATVTGANLPDLPPMFATPGLPPQGEYDPDKYAEFLQKATIQGPEDTLMGIEKLQQQNQNPYQNSNNNMSNFKNMEKLLQNIDGGIQSLIDNSSYMQNNNNLSQFPFSNSSSPNFMGGDILKWSSYK